MHRHSDNIYVNPRDSHMTGLRLTKEHVEGTMTYNFYLWETCTQIIQDSNTWDTDEHEWYI